MKDKTELLVVLFFAIVAVFSIFYLNSSNSAFTVDQIKQLQLSCPNIDVNEFASQVKCPEFPAIPSCPACTATASCPERLVTFYPNHTEQADCANLGPDWLNTYEGLSMQPFIGGGNKLKVKPYVSGMILHQGNIVVFDLNGHSIFHEIRGLYSDYLVTKGYANDSSERITYNQIKYIVTDVKFC